MATTTDNRIYKDQTAVKLTLITSIDFDTYTVTAQSIEYKKPDGTSGSWTASKTPGGASDGRIFVDFDDSIKFDQKGKWVLWAKLTFADTRIAYGNPYHYYVYEESEEQIT